MTKQNTPKQLIDYFGENKPVSMKEFRDFWGSLSDADKDYFRGVNLETGIFTPAA